ncbi:MAG: winged helix DNA-binding domain-containing protein [Ignavibacteria bacterium]|nr:winged helix DNA-binding domain-containing protein [Ignavibacteria bacterium]
MTDTTYRFRYWSYNRQLLGKRGTNLNQVLKDILGVYSSHPSAPLSLRARMRSFSEQAFYNLDKNKLAYRVPAMRLSAYILSRENANLVFAATIPSASAPIWEKRYSQKGRVIPKENYNDWKKQVLKLTTNPLTAKEIKIASDIPDEKIKLVLNRMTFEGRLLRVGAKSLRSNIISYVSTKEWAKGNFIQADNQKALGWLAGEYLRAFGPVRIKDFQWWTGVTASRAKAAVSTQKTTEIDDGYLLLSKDINKFEKFKLQTKDSLDILPQWDSYTMGYAPDGRERFVSQDMQDKIYGSLGATTGNALGTVLVNGMAHASWSSQFKGTTMMVKLNMFEKTSGKLNAEITNQFNEIAKFLKAKSIVIEKNKS